MASGHEGKAIAFHQGRVNIKISSKAPSPDLLIELLHDTDVRNSVVSALVLEFHELGMWSDRYHEETKQAMTNNEFWFEYIDEDAAVIDSIDTAVAPSQRYDAVKNKLDEDHVLISP